MKALLKLLFCAAVAASLLPGRALAMALPDDPGFTITNYDVHAVISAGDVYDVNELIQVNFTEQKHGIYRDIPLGDGGVVEDISVNGMYSMDNDGNTVRIKIGDPDVLVQGDQTYEIHYTFTPGDSGAMAADKLDYNIIGTDWDTSIAQVTFSLTLPGAFDAGKLGFSMGTAGISGYNADDLAFSVQENSIVGSTVRPLLANEGLAVHLDLPQGYFTAASADTMQNPPPDDVPARGIDQAIVPQFGGLILPGMLLFFLLFGGFVVVAVVIVAVALANKNKTAGGVIRATDQASQDMLFNETMRANQRQIQQDSTPPPPPPPADMGGGFPGGGTGGGGGSSW